MDIIGSTVMEEKALCTDCERIISTLTTIANTFQKFICKVFDKPWKHYKIYMF